MKNCVICGKPIEGKNKSREHIIHNAIGGSLDEEIYCKICNENYGSSHDKAFTQIFAPIVDKINMHKTRSTKGTSYTGVMCDLEGNLYTATYRDGKVVKLENDKSEYVKYEHGKYKALYQKFVLDNKAFKLGIAKIAFNYAVYCGIETWHLENVFDYSAKKVVDEPVVIPFVPMTLFDIIMEINPVEKIFHMVRIFNCENVLYAYIELFNTFQYYVLLSEKYNYVELGNVDKSYGNLIEMKEPVDEELKESLTPQNYKDVHIILNQYGIDLKELLKSLKEYHAYEDLERDEQDRVLREHIGKRAYEQIRKESYIKEYTELLKRQYDSINFINVISSLEDTERISRFWEDFQFYSSYDQDCINIKKYKKFLPDGSNYPEFLSKNLNNKQYITAYNYMKFYMLEERIK